METMAAMLNRSRTVDGVPTSLADLGYTRAAIDGKWYACKTLSGKCPWKQCVCDCGGVNGSYHDERGWSVQCQTKIPINKPIICARKLMGVGAPHHYSLAAAVCYTQKKLCNTAPSSEKDGTKVQPHNPSSADSRGAVPERLFWGGAGWERTASRCLLRLRARNV